MDPSLNLEVPRFLCYCCLNEKQQNIPTHKLTNETLRPGTGARSYTNIGCEHLACMDLRGNLAAIESSNVDATQLAHVTRKAAKYQQRYEQFRSRCCCVFGFAKESAARHSLHRPRPPQPEALQKRPQLCPAQGGVEGEAGGRAGRSGEMARGGAKEANEPPQY